MKQIVLEALRSLRRSKFSCFVFMLELTLLFWSCMIVGSYLVDLPTHREAANSGIHYFYASATDKDEENRATAQRQSLYFQPSSTDSILRVLHTLRQDSAFGYFYCRQSAVSLSSENLHQHLGEMAVAPYLAQPYLVNDIVNDFMKNKTQLVEEELYALPQEQQPRYNSALNTDAIGLSAFILDTRALAQFELAVQSGRLFTDDDCNISTPQQPICILMGSAYASYFTLGEKLSIYHNTLGRTFHAEIIGFLQEDAQIQVPLRPDAAPEATYLKNAIILPALHMAFAPQDTQEQLWLNANAASLLLEGSAVALPHSTTRKELTALQGQVKDLFLTNNLPPMFFGATSYGFLYFQNETEDWVSLLMSMVVLLLGCSLVFVCLFFVQKADRSMKRYAVFLINGCSIARLIASFVVEVVLLLVPPSLITCMLFFSQICNNPGYLLLLLSGVAVLLLLVSVLIVYKLQKIELETLLRRAE